MKKNTVVALLLIVAIFGLGIAYAAINNQTLVVEGTATAATSEDNFDVKFISATPGAIPEGQDGEVVAALDTTDATGRKATMTVTGLTTAGDTATATFKVKNASQAEIVAAIEDSVVNKNTTWYEVTSDLDVSTLAQGAEATLTVTVKLTKTPATQADLDAANANNTFTVSVVASPVSK